MKNFKRFTAAIAATLMAASLSVPMAMNVSAAENTISFTGEVGSTHTYTAYKIFGGVVKTTDADEVAGTPAKTELTNIVWANSNGAAAFLSALKEDETIGSKFTNCSNAAEVAAVLSTFANKSPDAEAFAKLVVAQKDYLVEVVGNPNGTITATSDGYYVVVENDMTASNGNLPVDSAMTSYLLAVYDASEGADLAVKAAIPSVEKKIQENVKTGNWQNDTKYGVRYNDTADFSIGDTVNFKLFGTMPENIDKYDSYKYVFHDNLGKEFTTPTYNTENVKVTIDGVQANGYTVSSSYNATTGTEITISFVDIKDGNVIKEDSKVEVSYSANLGIGAAIGKPGQKNTVYLEYSNNPNVGGTGTTSKTPTDTVIAFTYQLNVDKIDAANPDLKLSGAKFKLKALDGDHVNKWAQVQNGILIGWTDNEDVASELTSNANGQFVVAGLDDGKYSLTETEAPKGYNKLSDSVEFTITAETNNSQSDNDITGEELTALEIKVEGEDEATPGALDTGIVGMSVKNNSGSTLPSTGGMGTKLFFLGGGSMAAVAGIFLITKKRMGKNAE